MFESLSGSSSALMNAVVIGATNVVSTFVGLLLVDRWGRRPLLIQGGLQMMASQVGGVVLHASGCMWCRGCECGLLETTLLVWGREACNCCAIPFRYCFCCSCILLLFTEPLCANRVCVAGAAGSSRGTG